MKITKDCVLILLGVAALTGCDRHMKFSGTVDALNGQPLKNCTYEFQSRGRRISGTFEAPRFDEGYAVGFRTVAITLACDGYAPVHVQETPDGSLGNLVLTPLAAKSSPGR